MLLNKKTSSGHQVNLVCARKICINCCNDEYCEIKLCGDFVWKKNEEFCEWLFSKENSNYTALAHNLTGYDGSLILNYLVSNILPSEKLPEILLNERFGN
jgi:hypothetical protein